jgi:hypothetical protein
LKPRAKKPKTRKKRVPQLVISHLKEIKRELLDGEKRPVFLEFLKKLNLPKGLYALYSEKGTTYYVGKASDLKTRLNAHLNDRHANSWTQMSLFFLSSAANVAELEGLLVAGAKPPGNKQKPKIGMDLKKSLRKFLKEDAMSQIDEAIYPEKKEKEDSLIGRITPKKLKSLGQSRLAKILGISQGRVSQLVKKEPNWGALREHIKISGRRDAVLLLMEKQNVRVKGKKK